MPRSASRYFSPVPRHRRVVVSRCKRLSGRLLKAIAILESSGVKVPGASRLRREAKLLHNVYAQREFPIGAAKRQEVANAVQDAIEFDKMLLSLSTADLRRLGPEIRRAIDGTPDREEPSRRPYQFQSQFYVGCILRAGGLAARVPSSNGPAPDYVVTITSREYVVEVKRPQSESAIENKIQKARDQIRASGLKGGVVLDVTDCIDKKALFIEDDDPDLPPYHSVEGQKERLLNRCIKAVSDETGRRHRAGYESVLFLLVYFNGWRWTKRGPKGPEPFSGLLFQSLATVPGTLESWHARNFYEAFTKGWKANGLYVSRETGSGDW